MKIESFLENIIGQIKEIQLKLGFAREVIRLYYPVESLCRILGIECESARELLEILEPEKSFKNTSLGGVRFARSKERIEVCVPAEGAAYVHEQIPEPAFLAGLIALFQEHHALTIEEIRDYFAQTEEQYICEQMEPEAEFDYVLYFSDGKPDPWVYCVRMEMGHTIYHRFSREDWRGMFGNG